jgi:hypothetical protein
MGAACTSETSVSIHNPETIIWTITDIKTSKGINVQDIGETQEEEIWVEANSSYLVACTT